jgi:hypothetical protein
MPTMGLREAKREEERTDAGDAQERGGSVTPSYHKRARRRNSPIRRAVAGATYGAAALLAVGTTGCARTPAGAASQSRRQLLVQFTVRGLINPARHYFFAIDTTGDSSQGPIPAVAPPWGNGWGAGRIIYYVQIDGAQPGFYGVYRFDPNSNLLAPIYLGRPISTGPVQGTSTASFSLGLDSLATPTGAAPSQINFNIIATDRIPVDPNDRTPKLTDALGQSGNSYVTINSLTDRIYRNADSIEPETSGDVADPDLDITDWQVEVRGS